MTYRAFVSSTFEDLKAHRANVIKKLRRAGIHVDPMEDWTATSEEPRQFSMNRVNGCDLCVLLVGFRRGFVPDGAAISITQMEYETAIKQDIEVLVFLANEEAAWPHKFYELEKDQALKHWRDGLRVKHGAEFFDYNPRSIDVVPSIARWLQTRDPDTQEEPSAAIPEWESRRLTALVARWTNGFAAQISAGHHEIGNDASARYVDLFVQDQPATGPQSMPPRPLADLVAAPGPRSIVYGDGGSGKSTALLKLAADLARRAETEQDVPIPLFARLNLFDSIEHGFERLLEIVGSTVQLPINDMKRLWREGKRPLLFLLDGYNEIVPDCQLACAKALQELAQAARHGILVTSRPTVPLDSLVQYGFRAVDIVPLNDEQIQDFLDRYKVLGLYDKLTEPLKELGRNPFMLWALVQSSIGTGTSELPRNKGELYRNFVDRYLFELGQARKLPAPTRFNYERVKKPILSILALEMCRAGLTRLPEDVGTLKRIRDQLKRIRSDYEDLLEVRPHVFMPESAKPNEFLDEVVTNGVMRRTDDALEFMHQSVRDYFAAVALREEKLDSLLSEVPLASWGRPEEIRTVVNERPSRLHDAIVICSGLMAASDSLVIGLQDKDPLLAAECLASGIVVADTKAAFSETCLALLRDTNDDRRFVGCSCVRACGTVTAEIMGQIETILFSEEEWEGTRQEATRALEQVGSDTLVPTLLRLIGTTMAGTLALDAALTITRRIYGRADYLLAVGLMMWHFRDSSSSTPLEQREGRKSRKKMYSLYLAGHTPEELVDMVLNASSGSLPALALLRLLHRSAAVKRLLDIIRRQGSHTLAMLFVPQIEANDEIAGVLRQVLEDRESPFSVKLDAATGLSCIALQQDSPLRTFDRISISWNVRDFLVERAFDQTLPAHDRVAAAVGLAKGAEHSWLGRLLDRLRDSTEDIAFRLLVCPVEPEIWALRAHWVQLYEFGDSGDREQEFAEDLLNIALEDKNDFLRSVARVSIAKSSRDRLKWALRTALEKIDDDEASLQSRKAAVQILGMLPANEARAKLVELIREVGEPEGLIAVAIRSLADSPDLESALAEFDALIAAAPHCTVHSGRSLCLAALNRTEEALKDALHAVDLSPDDAQLHVRLGDIRIQMAQTRDAMTSYRRAVELDVRCADAFWGLAVAADQLGDVKEALTLGRSAAQLGMHMPHQLLNLGWFAYENGAFAESIDASRRAAELDPWDAMSLFNLGIALVATGNTAEATKSYEAGIDRCFAFPASTSSISGTLGDLDKLVSSRPELGSPVEDIKNRLRDCERRLKGESGPAWHHGNDQLL